MAANDRLVHSVRGSKAVAEQGRQVMSSGIFDPNFSPITLLMIALANPFVIGVAFLMGRQADQWQKLIIAGMAAALAGAAAAWQQPSEEACDGRASLRIRP